MTFSPYFLISLEGFINIFIYISNLSQEYGRHRNKGFKGLKVAIQQEQVSLNPFNPFFLPSRWYEDAATRKLAGPSGRFFRCGTNDPEKALGIDYINHFLPFRWISLSITGYVE